MFLKRNISLVFLCELMYTINNVNLFMVIYMLRKKFFWKHIIEDTFIFCLLPVYSMIFFWWSHWIWVFLVSTMFGLITASCFKENFFWRKDRPRILTGFIMCAVEYFSCMSIAWGLSSLARLDFTTLFFINNNIIITIIIHLLFLLIAFWPIKTLIYRRKVEKTDPFEDLDFSKIDRGEFVI